MKFFEERRQLKIAWVSQAAADEEFQAEYGGDYNLGVSPSDILKAMHQFTKRIPSTGEVAGSPKRRSINGISARAHLSWSENILSKEQAEALKHINYRAAEVWQGDDQSFMRGYLLYMHIARQNDKIPGWQYQSFEDIMQMTPSFNRLENVLRFSQLARREVAYLLEVMQDLHTSGIVELNEPALAQAGTGLAYHHCYQTLASVAELALSEATEAPDF